MDISKIMIELQQDAESKLIPGSVHNAGSMRIVNGHKLTACAELPFQKTGRRLHARTSFRVDGKRVAADKITQALGV